MLDGINSITFKKKGFTNKEEVFKLTNNNGFNINLHINGIDIKKRINNNLTIYFIEKFFRIIDGWKENYDNKNSIDSEHWSLEVIYNDGKNRYYSGNNYPNNFYSFESLLEDIINKVMEAKQ